MKEDKILETIKGLSGKINGLEDVVRKEELDTIKNSLKKLSDDFTNKSVSKVDFDTKIDELKSVIDTQDELIKGLKNIDDIENDFSNIDGMDDVVNAISQETRSADDIENALQKLSTSDIMNAVLGSNIMKVGSFSDTIGSTIIFKRPNTLDAFQRLLLNKIKYIPFGKDDSFTKEVEFIFDRNVHGKAGFVPKCEGAEKPESSFNLSVTKGIEYKELAIHLEISECLLLTNKALIRAIIRMINEEMQKALLMAIMNGTGLNNSISGIFSYKKPFTVTDLYKNAIESPDLIDVMLAMHDRGMELSSDGSRGTVLVNQRTLAKLSLSDTNPASKRRVFDITHKDLGNTMRIESSSNSGGAYALNVIGVSNDVLMEDEIALFTDDALKDYKVYVKSLRSVQRNVGGDQFRRNMEAFKKFVFVGTTNSVSGKDGVVADKIVNVINQITK